MYLFFWIHSLSIKILWEKRYNISIITWYDCVKPHIQALASIRLKYNFKMDIFITPGMFLYHLFILETHKTNDNIILLQLCSLTHIWLSYVSKSRPFLYFMHDLTTYTTLFYTTQFFFFVFFFKTALRIVLLINGIKARLYRLPLWLYLCISHIK